MRPISIRIDRFGRIAFNKNKELSQASFEKPADQKAPAGSSSEKSEKSEKEEESKVAKKEPNNKMRQKVRRRSSSNSLNVARDFKSDNVRRFHSIRNKNRKQLINRSKNDPMQLEFVIKRLSNK